MQGENMKLMLTLIHWVRHVTRFSFLWFRNFLFFSIIKNHYSVFCA